VTTVAAAERTLFIIVLLSQTVLVRSWFIGADYTAETSSGQLGPRCRTALEYEVGGETLPLRDEKAGSTSVNLQKASQFQTAAPKLNEFIDD
jgi:hypothetical protein